jgi:hypothetical protein
MLLHEMLIARGNDSVAGITCRNNPDSLTSRNLPRHRLISSRSRRSARTALCGNIIALMSVTWLRALSVLIPLCLFAGSMALLGRARTLCTILQVLGSGCFLGVVLTHTSAALRSWTDWLAVVGLVIFSVAFFFHALSRK